MRDLEIPDRVLIGGDNTIEGKKAVNLLVEYLFFMGSKKKYFNNKFMVIRTFKINCKCFFSSKNIFN